MNPQAQGAQGHPKLVADSKGRLHAVWDEGLAPDPPAPAPADAKSGEQRHHHAAPASGGAGRAIMYAVSRDGGATFTSARALVPSPGVYQFQPSLTVGPDSSVFVTWNEIDQDGKHVVFARLAQRPAAGAANPMNEASPSVPGGRSRPRCRLSELH